MRGWKWGRDFREYPIPKDALASETPAALENQECIVTLPLKLLELMQLLLRNSQHLFVLRALHDLCELVQEARDVLQSEV